MELVANEAALLHQGRKFPRPSVCHLPGAHRHGVSAVFIFIPTITANLASKLIVNRDAFTHEEQEEIKDALNAISARLGVDAMTDQASGR